MTYNRDFYIYTEYFLVNIEVDMIIEEESINSINNFYEFLKEQFKKQLMQKELEELQYDIWKND